MADTPAENSAPDEGGLSIVQYTLIAGGGFVLVIILIFIGALVLALTNSEAVSIVQVIRDVFLIALSLQGILISVAFVVFVVQVVRFINLLKTEFRVILVNMQNTVKEAQTTAEFVSANAIGPLIRISAFFAGLAAFFSELANIRKAIRPTKKASENDAKSA
jgi:hypothetical protein